MKYCISKGVIMMKLRNNKKIMITVKVMIILSLLLSSLLFLSKKSPTVYAEGGSTEMTNRVLRKYPSKDTYTKIGAYYQDKNTLVRPSDLYNQGHEPKVLKENPGGMFIIPPYLGDIKDENKNSANYWYPDEIVGAHGTANAGIIRSQEPINLLDEDFEITFKSRMTNYDHTDIGYNFYFTTDNEFVPYSIHDYGSLGIYAKWGLDGTDEQAAMVPAMKNSLAVEFDSLNQLDALNDNTRRIDGLVQDKDGNTFGTSNNERINGDHIAITFPHESEYVFNEQTKGIMNDKYSTPIPTPYPPRNSEGGFFLPHHALSKVGEKGIGDASKSSGYWSTQKITWRLKDGGATNSYIDNVYEISYEYYHKVKEDVTTPSTDKLVATGSLEIPFWITPTPENPWPNDFYHTFLYDKNKKDIRSVYDTRPNYGGQIAPDTMAPTQKPTDSEIRDLVAANPIKTGITAATADGLPRQSWIFAFENQLNYTVNYYIEGTTTKVPDLILDQGDSNPYNNSNPYQDSAVVNTKLRIIPPISPTYDLVPNQDLTPTITTEGQVINIYYKAKTLDYTIEYYNNGVKMEPSATDTLPRSGSVPSTNPNVTSVPITNCPEGSAVASYEFPAGTKVGPPSATNPYKITTRDNVIKVNYKSSIIENPNEDQSNDPDYLILNFDANDLNNGLSNEEIRGRLTSKTNSAIKDQETIKYAVLKGTPWSKVVEKAAVPKLEIQSGNWLFKAPTTGYNKNQWTTQRTGGTNIPEQNSTTKIDDLYQNGTRELTYYAQFTQNTPVGIKDKINSIIALASASSLLFLTYFYLIIRKKKDTIR